MVWLLNLMPKTPQKVNHQGRGESPIVNLYQYVELVKTGELIPCCFMNENTKSIVIIFMSRETTTVCLPP